MRADEILVNAAQVLAATARKSCGQTSDLPCKMACMGHWLELLRGPVRGWVVGGAVFCTGLAGGQTERHGRGYKPPPPTAEVVITVEKNFNGKPLPNASVIFRSSREGATNGVLEMKTDPEGQAKIDLLEVGSHVTVQVLANGFATYASEFDLTDAGKEVLVKMQRPRTQVSAYEEKGGTEPANVQPGVQEHKKAAPTAEVPAPASPMTPLQTTPPANTPATAPANGSAPTAAPGSPR